MLSMLSRLPEIGSPVFLFKQRDGKKVFLYRVGSSLFPFSPEPGDTFEVSGFRGHFRNSWKLGLKEKLSATFTISKDRPGLTMKDRFITLQPLSTDLMFKLTKLAPRSDDEVRVIPDPAKITRSGRQMYASV